MSWHLGVGGVYRQNVVIRPPRPVNASIPPPSPIATAGQFLRRFVNTLIRM